MNATGKYNGSKEVTVRCIVLRVDSGFLGLVVCSRLEVLFLEQFGLCSSRCSVVVDKADAIRSIKEMNNLISSTMKINAPTGLLRSFLPAEECTSK